MRSDWRRPCETSDNGKSGTAENSETASGTAANKAIRLRGLILGSQVPALNDAQTTTTSASRLPEPFPASPRERPSAAQRPRRAPLALATLPLLQECSQIPPKGRGRAPHSPCAEPDHELPAAN